MVKKDELDSTIESLRGEIGTSLFLMKNYVIQVLREENISLKKN